MIFIARSQQGHSVTRECPRVMAHLQRSAGGVPLSLWSWSSGSSHCSKDGLDITFN